MPKLQIVSRETPFPGSILVGPPKAGPGLILLHGSDGGESGWNSAFAMFFAAHGFHALALSSWANDLRDVELLETFDAIEWLGKQRFVKGHDVGVSGASRGGEHALLIGALSAKYPELPQPKVIAAHSPIDRVVSGYPEQARHAWKFRGTYADVEIGKRIKIEKFKRPLFITHGMQFEYSYWNWKQTKRIEKRLEASGRKCDVHLWKKKDLQLRDRMKDADHDCEIHYFKHEGHIFNVQGEELRRLLLLNFLCHHLR